MTHKHAETGGWIAYDNNGQGHWGATREIAEKCARAWN